MMRRLQLLHLLIATLLECKAQAVKPCKHVHRLDIKYVQGHSISVSCLTTTHPLPSLTVKLHRTDPLKVIQLYSDSSPASEHQRWTVSNKDGNITLHLKDVRSSDEGLYDCQVHNGADCLHQTQFNLTVGCKILNPVYTKPNTSVFLPCSEHPQQNRTQEVTWKVISGHQTTDINKYHQTYKQTDSTETPPDPLYMRAKPQRNGSLLIMKTANIDQHWYRCTVNETTCYEVKLVMTGASSTATLVISTTLTATGSTEGLFRQTEDNTSASNVKAVTSSVLCLCVLVSLIIGLIYLKKRRDKMKSQMTLTTRFSVYYSEVTEEFDVPVYSLVENNRENMTTFGVEQSEAPESIPENMYERIK